MRNAANDDLGNKKDTNNGIYIMMCMYVQKD